MPLTDAQHMGQQKAIVKCLIAIHQERSPPLPPVLPWLALNGRVVKDPVYETAHAEHGSWGAAIAASLIAAVNQYRATQTGRATVAIKAPSALVEPLDALAVRCGRDDPFDNPDAFYKLAESMGLAEGMTIMRSTRGNAARGSVFEELPRRQEGGRAAGADAQPATDDDAMDTDDGATTRAAAAADARRVQLLETLAGLTVPDLLKLGAAVGSELIMTMIAGHAMALGVHGFEHAVSVGACAVSIRSVHHYQVWWCTDPCARPLCWG